MRVRANYGSIDQYLALFVDERRPSRVFPQLCAVTRATLSGLELYVARKVGKDSYAGLVDDYLAGDEDRITDATLRARAQALGFA